MLTLRRAAMLVLAFAVLFTVTVSAASARTYDRGETVWFSNLELGSGDEVRGNLEVVFGDVTCADGAEIDGDVRTFFGHFEKLDGCQVDGRVVNAGDFESLPWFGPVAPDNFSSDRGFTKKLAWDVVVGFAFLLFPLRVRIALDRVEKHPGLSGITGAVVMVAALPVCVLLALSIIGIPLIPIEIAILCAGLWIGNAALGLLLGRRLYELLRPTATPSPLGALALGLVVITAAETLPVVGWAVFAVVALVGLGAAILAFVREPAFRSFTGGTSTPGSPPGSTPMNRPASP
jgi:hypothetical protein